jgi:ketosteroid isomerase-like protein
MSQENVELALRADDAFKRGDLDAFLALCDPDLEFHSRLVATKAAAPTDAMTGFGRGGRTSMPPGGTSTRRSMR